MECGFYHKDFSSTRGWVMYGDVTHNPANKTIQLITEQIMPTQKTWNICSLWSKRKIYWHEGFEMKLVFRMRVPDLTNNGGEGFAMVFQQDRHNAMGDLRNKGGRPNGQTYTPSGLGLNDLKKSWALKFDTSPQTTDPSSKPYISIHEGGDWINPYPSSAFTDQIPPMNNAHDHTVKIYYDIEDSVDGPVGMLRLFWTSDYQGHPSWGTLNKPILVTRVHFDALDKRPAYLGFTSTTSETRFQTVDIVAWAYHETRTVNAQGHKCFVCGGINLRCCNHWEMMRNERDGTQSNSFISQAGHYIGQNPKGEPPIPGYSPDLVDKPRLWQHQVWDVPTFRSTQTDPGASRT